MTLRIRHGFETFLLGHRGGGESARPVRFLDHGEAHRFVRQIAGDPEVATSLRRLERGPAGSMDYNHESHDVFAQRVASDLVSGVLRVAVVKTAQSTGWASAGEIAVEAERPAPAPPSMRIAPGPAAPAPMPPEPADVVIDVAQQVEALVGAARTGTAFCEQCAAG